MSDTIASEIARQVLIVEDHEPTAQLIATCVEGAGTSVSTDIVRDGDECLTVLRGEHDSIQPPDLILLDLGLPTVHGTTVLKTMLEDPGVREVPTVVLSGSDDPKMIGECYDHGANAFISKPGDLDRFRTIAEGVVQFWLSADPGGETVVAAADNRESGTTTGG